MNKKALLLHTNDNCIVALTDIRRGDAILYGGGEVIATADIALGHKVAIADIAEGGKVIKYGAIIGSATAAIARGDHIHTQNLASDYITHPHGRKE
jgi:altronate dehydratase